MLAGGFASGERNTAGWSRWQLDGLITHRSLVRVQPPQLEIRYASSLAGTSSRKRGSEWRLGEKRKPPKAPNVGAEKWKGCGLIGKVPGARWGYARFESGHLYEVGQTC